jgi:serine/threonine-protein kinase
MTMMYVPAGSFTMGSDAYEDDEKPAHLVTLDAFWIDKFEVTNAMYALCVKAARCPAPSDKSSSSKSIYYGNPQFENFPVIYVSWENANVYCKWAGRQLPSEAQWEKAARGSDGRVYPWGNVPPDKGRLNYANIVDDTTEVGKYPSGASVYGALDMAGNVMEWVSDWFEAKYYSVSPKLNPTGPASGKYHILRGGAWNNDEFFVRTSYRAIWDVPELANNTTGFRCAALP